MSRRSNRVVVKGNGAVLSGYNFSGVDVCVYGNNVTIQDCTFNDAGGTLAAVQQMNMGATGLTVQNCTFSGGTEPYGVLSSSPGYLAVINNSFIDSPAHPVTLSNGVVTGNYFSGSGYIPGACRRHQYPIHIRASHSQQQFHRLDEQRRRRWSSTGFAIRIATDDGNTSNVSVTGNVMLGGAYTVFAMPTKIVSRLSGLPASSAKSAR